MTNKNKQLYKVVRVTRRGFRSVMVSHAPWVVEYARGAWSRPTVEGTKLFVFDKESDARRYQDLDPARLIFTCEIAGEPERPRKVSSVFDSLAEFWRQRHAGECSHLTMPPWEGTVWVDAVKLVSLVE